VNPLFWPYRGFSEKYAKIDERAGIFLRIRLY
jgi:hypothetical protein